MNIHWVALRDSIILAGVTLIGAGIVCAIILAISLIRNERLSFAVLAVFGFCIAVAIFYVPMALGS